MAKILIVDDDDGLCNALSLCLKAEHHAVETVADGEEALDRLKAYTYDIVVLDWKLPRISGLEVCKEYRALGGRAPVLFLTGKGSVIEKVEGLDAGADDYLAKPFDMNELLARLRAMLRRPHQVTSEVLQAGDINLDARTFTVTKGGAEVSLIKKEFAVLEFFMRHPNEVYNIATIMERLWPAESESSPEVIRAYIKTLRQKLESDGKPPLFQTVHRVGYKFVPPA